jgi:Fe-S-cluster containining protein
MSGSPISKPAVEVGLAYCTRCGECCRRSTCHIGSQQEAGVIAARLGMPLDEFLNTKVTAFKVDGGLAVKPRMGEHGCVFLTEAGECGIEDVKPSGGRDYECWTPATFAPGVEKKFWWARA